MAKKKTIRRRARPTSAARQAAPADARDRLEHLDQRLVSLAHERATLFRQLVAERQRADGTIGDLLYALPQVTDSDPGPLSARCIQSIFRELQSGCRELVRGTKIAYLGPPYSYSHLAAVERFGSSGELLPAATIAAVFEAVQRRQADYGLVPIENSTDGRVADTLDMFARTPVHICGEVQLRIHHYLMGRCSLAEVQEVYSKPQALSQCRNWLAKYLPLARTAETTSTATAAQLAADKPGAAAIASRQAATNYSLSIIAGNIEDNRNNITRFAVIGSESPPPSGDDKTSLLFEIPHRPGALADAMSIFKRHRLNLTWIESFPMSGSKNEYVFFVEFEGHQSARRAQLALAALEGKTVRLRVLGSYARALPAREHEA